MVARAELMAAGVAATPASLLGTSINSALAAAGTTQLTATALKGCGFAVVTTVGANSGVRLDAFSANPTQVVVNGGLNTLTVYPAVGNTIAPNAINVGVQVAVGKSATFQGHGLTGSANISA
jgi:hypothetical protein